MALHPLVLSPFVALLGMAIVYTDSRRRSISSRKRWTWTVGIGIASLSGFAFVYLFDTVFLRAYRALLGRSIVVSSPQEIVNGLFVVGITITLIAVLVYGLRSRHEPANHRNRG